MIIPVEMYQCVCDAERELGILNNSIVACLKIGIKQLEVIYGNTQNSF